MCVYGGSEEQDQIWQQYKSVRSTNASAGIAVSAFAEESYIVCIFSEIVTSICP
jgi:hypothetical protein